MTSPTDPVINSNDSANSELADTPLLITSNEEDTPYLNPEENHVSISHYAEDRLLHTFSTQKICEQLEALALPAEYSEKSDADQTVLLDSGSSDEFKSKKILESLENEPYIEDKNLFISDEEGINLDDEFYLQEKTDFLVNRVIANYKVDGGLKPKKLTNVLYNVFCDKEIKKYLLNDTLSTTFILNYMSFLYVHENSWDILQSSLITALKKFCTSLIDYESEESILVMKREIKNKLKLTGSAANGILKYFFDDEKIRHAFLTNKISSDRIKKYFKHEVHIDLTQSIKEQAQDMIKVFSLKNVEISEQIYRNKLLPQ